MHDIPAAGMGAGQRDSSDLAFLIHNKEVTLRFHTLHIVGAGILNPFNPLTIGSCIEYIGTSDTVGRAP